MRLISWLLALLLTILAVDAMAAEAARVGVRTGEHDDRSRIVFDWTGPVGVTIEQPAAGQLIVVFDKPADFDLSKARVDKLSRVASIEPVGDRPALRIKLKGVHGYKLSDSDFKIVVDILDDTAETPSAEKAISKNTTKKNKQEQASYSQSDTAASTARDAAASRPATARTKDDIVPSAQPQPPATTAAVQPAAVSPAGPAGTAPAQDAAVATAKPVGPIPNPLLNLAAWRGGNSFSAARAKFAERIAADHMKADSLLQLARFLLAWRHADEALSTLADLKARYPKFAARYDATLLNDAAQLLAGRPGTSAGVFAIRTLRDKPEAKLWQGVAAALSGHADEAFRAFEIGKPALAAYPPNLRSFLGLLAMQAAIDSNALDAAQSYQTIVADSHPVQDEAAMLEALSGLLLAKAENPDAARPHLLAAARSPALKPQIVARLALIELDRADGKLGNEAALDGLEQLYYSWEGDGLQLDILEQLTALLIEQKRYSDAFDAIAAAKRRFPDDPRAERMSANAHELFRNLMIGTATDALDPLEAVALHDGHPELMPGGAADAAAITRGLADRLVSLDLIEPAAHLYDEAMQNAPATERAEIGAKLADLRLAAGDDAGAIKTLDATYADGLPAATQAHRAAARATALARSGNQTAALAALGGGDAARTRADLDLARQQLGPGRQGRSAGGRERARRRRCSGAQGAADSARHRCPAAGGQAHGGGGDARQVRTCPREISGRRRVQQNYRPRRGDRNTRPPRGLGRDRQDRLARERDPLALDGTVGHRFCSHETRGTRPTMSSDSMTWHRVASRSKLTPANPLAVEVGDKLIGLYLVDGTVYAIGNLCTHEFALLTEGFVEGDAIECPLHQARFSIKTGKVLSEPTRTSPAIPSRSPATISSSASTAGRTGHGHAGIDRHRRRRPSRLLGRPGAAQARIRRPSHARRWRAPPAL